MALDFGRLRNSRGWLVPIQIDRKPSPRERSSRCVSRVESGDLSRKAEPLTAMLISVTKNNVERSHHFRNYRITIIDTKQSKCKNTKTQDSALSCYETKTPEISRRSRYIRTRQCRGLTRNGKTVNQQERKEKDVLTRVGFHKLGLNIAQIPGPAST